MSEADTPDAGAAARPGEASPRAVGPAPDPVGAPAFGRILLKLSGEALMGDLDYGIDPAYIARIAAEVKAVSDLGVEVAMVIGGGNIFRGAGLAEAGMDRVTGLRFATVTMCDSS